MVATFFISATASLRISSMISISFPEKEMDDPDSSDDRVDSGIDVPRPISVPSLIFVKDMSDIIKAFIKNLWL